MAIRSHNFKDRTGEVRKNRCGTEMEIISYNNSHHITVQFHDSNRFITETKYSSFNKGMVQNPYDKTVHKTGFLGVGDAITSRDGRDTPIYSAWGNMLKRCYSEKSLLSCPTYAGCTVAPEWHNFQTFAQWYENNFYVVNNETMDLDKDILFKGNKIYSPETCVFVTHRINSLFISRKSLRGEYPIGVCYARDKHKFQSKIRDEKTTKHLGWFDTPDEAFDSYKIYKESLAKDIAEEYKNFIPEKLYQALLNYRVEIND